MNKYKITTNGKTFIRFAEYATDATKRLANQYGWIFRSRGMYDADTRGEMWHEVFCYTRERGTFRVFAEKIG